MIEVKNIHFTYQRQNKPVFKDLSFTFSKGFNVVLGPNGAGKSTLIKSIFGLLEYQGEIFYGEESITNMSINERIKLMSYLPQVDINFSSLTVLEMVLLGRLPDLERKVSDQDLDIVMDTLDAFAIKDLAKRRFSELSGGQQKLVFIAQTLVREPKIILLDEPTNSLDLQKQLELCHLLQSIVREKKIDLIVILHDINLAARYADYLVIIDQHGHFYSSGKAREVITAKMLYEVYGVVAKVTIDEEGIPLVSPKYSIRNIKKR